MPAGQHPQLGGAAARTRALVVSAQQAAAAARSVEMRGDFHVGSKFTSFDVSFAGQGMAASLSTWTAASPSAETIYVVDTGASVYVAGPAALLRQQHLPAAMCRPACARYVRVPLTAASWFLASYGRAALMREAFGWVPAAPGGFRHIALRHFTWGRLPVACGNSRGYRVCVARQGIPYLLSADKRDKRGWGVVLSRWNRIPAIAAPPASQLPVGG